MPITFPLAGGLPLRDQDPALIVVKSADEVRFEPRQDLHVGVANAVHPAYGMQVLSAGIEETTDRGGPDEQVGAKQERGDREDDAVERVGGHEKADNDECR